MKIGRLLNNIQNATQLKSQVLVIKNISPWWVTSITDAEGNFSISVSHDKIYAAFKVSQKSHSIDILYALKNFFNCGTVYIDNKKYDAYKFVVGNHQDIVNKVIPHFNKYPLVSSKHLDYVDFVEAVALFDNKARVKNRDLIISIKQAMNK